MYIVLRYVDTKIKVGECNHKYTKGVLLLHPMWYN